MLAISHVVSIGTDDLSDFSEEVQRAERERRIKTFHESYVPNLEGNEK